MLGRRRIVAEAAFDLVPRHRTVARIVVGRRVRDSPGHILRVRLHGTTELLPRSLKVADAGFRPTETLDIVWQAPGA